MGWGTVVRHGMEGATELHSATETAELLPAHAAVAPVWTTDPGNEDDVRTPSPHPRDDLILEPRRNYSGYAVVEIADVSVRLE